MRFLVASWTLGIAVAGSACAQYVISSHAGVVQYVEGRAFLADKPVEPKLGQFPDIKANQEFRTEEGRAEVLLTPGVFVRLGEHSAIRMLSTALTDVQVEVLSGSAIVEASDLPKDNSITLVYKTDTMRLQKQGLYRVDTEPAHFQVFEGEAVITDGSGQLTLKSGKQTNLAGVLMAENFDRKADDQDALYRWSSRRASYVAQANVESASTVASGSGGAYGLGSLGYATGYTGFGYNSAFLGGWAYNPIFGMYTYVPYSGFSYSPFGYTYYSTETIAYAPVYINSGLGSARINRLTGSSRLSGSSGLTSASARSFGGGGGAFASGGRASIGGGGASIGGGGAMGGGGGGGRAGGGHR